MRTCILILSLFAASGAHATEVDTRLTLLNYSFDQAPTPRTLGTSLLVDLRLRTEIPETGLFAGTLIALTPSVTKQFGLGERSSFVELGWRHPTWEEHEAVSLLAYPFSSQRLHLGYEHPATWGRSHSGIGYGGNRALELRLTRGTWHTFAAVRTITLLNESTLETEQGFDWFAGGGAEIFSFLSAEAGARRVDYGVVDAVHSGEERARATAVSGRLLFHSGDRINPSPDYARYAGDPDWPQFLFERESYSSRLSTSVSLEATYLAQKLSSQSANGLVDVDDLVVALQARGKKGNFRVHAFALYRSASFPDIVTPQDGFVILLPWDSARDFKPETALSAGVDYHLSRLAVTAGLVLNASLPASIQLDPVLLGANNPPGFSGGPRTMVKTRGYFKTLPDGDERAPIFGAKLTMLWNYESLGAFLEAGWTHDPNRASLQGISTGGAPKATKLPAELLEFAAVLQARF